MQILLLYIGGGKVSNKGDKKQLQGALRLSHPLLLWLYPLILLYIKYLLVIKRRSQCTKYYIVWALYANIMKVQSFTSGCITTIDGKDKCIAFSPYNHFETKLSSHLDNQLETTKCHVLQTHWLKTYGKVDMMFATSNTCVIDLKTKPERDISEATKLWEFLCYFLSFILFKKYTSGMRSKESD